MRFFFIYCLSAGIAFLSGCNTNETAATAGKEPLTVEATATTELCECINKSMSELNPKVRSIIVKAGQSNEPIQVLQSEMLQITDPTEQEKIANEFGRLENNAELKKCSEDIKNRYGFSDEDKQTQEKILQVARENKECDLVYALMKIGKQQQSSGGDAGMAAPEGQ